MRYAIITKIEVYNHDELIGVLEIEDGMGFKAKLEDKYMTGDDIKYLGRVQTYLEEELDDSIVELDEETK